MISEPDFGARQGGEIGELAGEERGRALAVLLSERLPDEPRLIWFVAGLAEAVDDLDLAEHIVKGAMAELQDERPPTPLSTWVGCGSRPVGLLMRSSLSTESAPGGLSTRSFRRCVPGAFRSPPSLSDSLAVPPTTRPAEL